MQDIHEILKTLAIPYIELKHPAVYTCEEAEKYYQGLEGARTKNLLLRNKKGDRAYLVVAETSRRLDFKEMEALLGESKLSFASAERMMKLLALTPGSVSPFGLINDTTKAVTVVIDRNLYKHNKVHFHPNDNTATLELSVDDFKKFLEWCGNKVILFG